MGKLQNWRYEKFAELIVGGTDIKEAFVLAGFEQSSVACRNYNRVRRRPDVAARIAELEKERDDAARAAGMSPPAVLMTLKGCGVERLDEFFERDDRGIFRIRDLRTVPVEASIALLRFLREGLGLHD
jgi:hypothetical protein